MAIITTSLIYGGGTVVRRVVRPDEYRALRMALQLDPEAAPHLAERLREMRTEHGLSLSAVSELCGLAGRGSAGGWETQGLVPELGTLLLLADYYGVGLDYLIGREGATRDSHLVAQAKAGLNDRLRHMDLTAQTSAQRVAAIWQVAQEVNPYAFPPSRVAGLIGGLAPEVFADLVAGQIRPSDVVVNRFAFALGIPEQLLLKGRYG